jgi:chromosome segregation ATPase
MATYLNERALAAMGFDRSLIAALRRINQAVGTGEIDLGTVESLLFVTQALSGMPADLQRTRSELEGLRSDIQTARSAIDSMRQQIGELTARVANERRPGALTLIENRLNQLEAATFCS